MIYLALKYKLTYLSDFSQVRITHRSPACDNRYCNRDVTRVISAQLLFVLVEVAGVPASAEKENTKVAVLEEE